MSWHLFDERGRRAQRLTYIHNGDFTLPGWISHNLKDEVHAANVFGFSPERSWRPTYFAAKMAKGYRVFELDVGEHQFVTENTVTDWWQSCSPDQKRLPTMAAVEMFLRMTA